MIEPTHSRFRWLERGDGEPVLLLHGLMGEMDHWESALETLGAFCRPIARELPIFDPGLTDVSLPALAGYLRRFGLPPAVVGGNSLELALTHPGWVAGLILTGSSGLFERTFTQKVPHRPTAAYVSEAGYTSTYSWPGRSTRARSVRARSTGRSVPTSSTCRGRRA